MNIFSQILPGTYAVASPARVFFLVLPVLNMVRGSSYDPDPRQRVRTVPMKVLVLGLSRTGTECDYALLVCRNL